MMYQHETHLLSLLQKPLLKTVMYKDLASLCGGGEEGSCHKVGTEKMINLDCQHS